MQVRLLVSNDKANVKKVVLRSDTLIGRSSECNLRIASREVSRKHCSVLLSESQVRVRDLGSSNGTFLNGERLNSNMDVPLPSGSELVIGNVTFVVQHDAPLPEEEPGSTVEVAKVAPGPQVGAETHQPEDDDSPATVPQRTTAEGSDEQFSGETGEADVTEQATLDTIRETAEETIGEAPAEQPGELDESDAEEDETVDMPSAPAASDQPKQVASDQPEEQTSDGLADTIAFDFSGTASGDDNAETAQEPSTDVHREVPAESAEQTESAAGQTGETDDDEAHADTGPGKASGLKSLFGFFRPKGKQQQESPTTEADKSASEATEDISQDDQTIKEGGDAEGFAPDESPAEETVMDSAVEVPGPPSENVGDEGMEFPDENAPAAEHEDDTSAEHAESDDDLQDFLRNLSQD